MTNPKATLKELIQIAHDSTEFYTDAAKEVRMPELAELFTRMAGHKKSLAATLSHRLSTLGATPPDSGTVSGWLRKAYAEIRVKITGKQDKAYVAQLEDTEDRLLRHFEEAINDPDNAPIRAELFATIGQVRACHNEMRSWNVRLNPKAA
jgi:uncharacterized protein (TIGR02284 family)